MHAHLLIFLGLLIYVVHLFRSHPYNNIIFNFMFCRVVITGISEDQNLFLKDDNYASTVLCKSNANVIQQNSRIFDDH